MAKAQFIYVTYIRSTPEKVWAALTDPRAMTKGWPAVLSSLQSFLETGTGLESSWGAEERRRAGEA
jgi:uncharacterized protein YndB with AHSA1/START domain